MGHGRNGSDGDEAARHFPEAQQKNAPRILTLSQYTHYSVKELASRHIDARTRLQ